MDSLVRQLLRESIAPSTRRTYRTAQSQYYSFCVLYHTQIFPLTQETLMRFVGWLAARGLAHATIKGYLSGVRHAHLMTLGTDPAISGMPLLHSLLQGVKRAQARSGSVVRRRLPITAVVMRLLKSSWESTRGASYEGKLLWALACVCFFGFLRSGEATVPTLAGYDRAVHLSMADVSMDSAASPSVVSLRIKESKTDPFRSGVTVHLGRTDRDLCPVAALLSFVADRGLQPGPLFVHHDGRPVTRQWLVNRVREAIAFAGMDPTPFSGHSFRSGAATTAAAAGVEDAVIKTLGRWSSQAYQVYVQLPRSSLAGVCIRLAQ